MRALVHTILIRHALLGNLELTAEQSNKSLLVHLAGDRDPDSHCCSCARPLSRLND
jgi:hypothetical protein